MSTDNPSTASAPRVSRVATNIDYDRDGKQVSYLGVPISTNESAYGTVPVPITVIRNGTGPTVYLSGGVHGDEFEGPIALMKLARELEAAEVQGRIIITPCLNLPAVLAGKRCSPIDGLNLNRVFPGDADGSATLVIAHYVSTVLLPLCDVQIDLHSGGNTLTFIPYVQMIRSRDKDLERRTLEAIKVFGTPVGLLTTELDPSGNLETLCEKLGVMTIQSELGGGGTVSKTNVGYAHTGALNLLRHFGLIEGAILRPEDQGRPPMRLMAFSDASCYVMAPDDGLFEPFFELGDPCEEGDPIGQVHYPHHIEKLPWTVHATQGGTLLSKRPPGIVRRGDNVAIIAQEMEPA